LPGFTRDGSTWVSNRGQRRQGERKEAQIPTATSLKPSVPKQLPLPIEEETTTRWTTPWIVEIAVGLEINSYTRAELN